VRRRPAAVAAALVVAGTLLAGCSADGPHGPRASPSSPAPTAPVAPDCGPAVTKADGSTWRCVFSDDFDGDALDTSKWLVLSSAASGYRNGPECYLGAGSPLGSDDVAVSDGTLRLTARELDHEITCPSLGGDFTSRWTGAFVTTYYSFTTTFGRVEVRAAFPDTEVAGVHSALWLWPPDLAYGSDTTGEIDLAEFYSVYPDRVIPFLHYQPAVPDGTNTNDYCLVDDVTKMHDYVIEWEPGHVHIAYDGQTCVDHDIDPAPPLTGSEPFDQRYAIDLTQALGNATNAFTPDTPLPATTTVDYVRVWS
jgi:beta-glucanase (GH16 family)